MTERNWKYRGSILLSWILLVIFLGAGLSNLKLDTSLDNWQFQDDSMGDNHGFTVDEFGNLEPVAILVRSDSIFSHQSLIQLRQFCEDLMDSVSQIESITSLINYRIIKPGNYPFGSISLLPSRIPNSLVELDSIKRQVLQQREIVGHLLNEACTETWVMISLKPIPANTTKYEYFIQVGKHVQQVVETHIKQDFQLIPTGIPIISFQQLEYFNAETLRLALLVSIVGTAVILLLFRSIMVVLAIYTSLGATFISALGILGHLHLSIDSTLFTIPLFLGVSISIGYSVHIINRYKIFLRKSPSPKLALNATMAVVSRPLLYTALTTIGALLTFNLIGIHAVRQIGNLSALIIALAYLNNQIVTPLLLSYRKATLPDSSLVENTLSWLTNRLAKTSLWLSGKPTVLFMGLALFLILTIAGFRMISLDSNSFTTLGTKAPYLKQLQELSRSPLAFLYSYNIFIKFSQDDFQTQAQDIVATTARVEAFLLEKNPTLIIKSGLTGLRLLRENLPLPQTEEQATSSSKNLMRYLRFVPRTVLAKWINTETNVVRIAVGIKEYNYRQTMAEKNSLEDFFAKNFPNAKLGFSGTILQFAEIQNYLVRGQVMSMLAALAIVTLLLIMVFRSVVLGFIATLPNLIPVMAVGATMGFLRIPLDSITITLMPMVLGVAVDDTIHIMTGLIKRRLNRINKESVLHDTFNTVGNSLLTTTIILIVIFSVYFTSEILVFNNLALLVIVGLVSALLTDFLVTPYLIQRLQTQMEAGNNLDTNKKQMELK